MSIERGVLGSVVVPVDSSYIDFRVAGSGVVTDSTCGKYKGSSYLCENVAGVHNHVGFDGVSYAGKTYVHKIFMSCDKPSCPACYKFGWAVRESRKISDRLAEASKRLGLMPEHFSVSVPLELFRLPFAELVKRVLVALKDRGIYDGGLIFHRDRFHWIDGRRAGYWSFHFHFLGFAKGRAECRTCKKTCSRGCGGFVDRNYRCGEKDGFIVKLLGKRKTIGGTAWYQLSHASYNVNMKRRNIVRWIGACSYRRLKFKVVKRKHLCPACGSELVEKRYVGDKPEILAWLHASRDPEVKGRSTAWVSYVAEDWVAVVREYG